MSFLTIEKVKMVGLAACVPPTIEENLTLPIFADKSEAEKVIASTGIERKRVVKPGTTASDLTYQAITKLLNQMEWSADSVDALIYVCTSRDYIAPITAAILQDRLGFRKDCYCLDLPLGCSGWVYGMSNLSSLFPAFQLLLHIGIQKLTISAAFSTGSCSHSFQLLLHFIQKILPQDCQKLIFSAAQLLPELFQRPPVPKIGLRF